MKGRIVTGIFVPFYCLFMQLVGIAGAQTTTPYTVPIAQPGPGSQFYCYTYPSNVPFASNVAGCNTYYHTIQDPTGTCNVTWDNFWSLNGIFGPTITPNLWAGNGYIHNPACQPFNGNGSIGAFDEGYNSGPLSCQANSVLDTTGLHCECPVQVAQMIPWVPGTFIFIIPRYWNGQQCAIEGTPPIIIGPSASSGPVPFYQVAGSFSNSAIAFNATGVTQSFTVTGSPDPTTVSSAEIVDGATGLAVSTATPDSTGTIVVTATTVVGHQYILAVSGNSTGNVSKYFVNADPQARGSAPDQTVPFYVDNTAFSAVIPVTFNGVTAATVPELWSVSALVDVQYDGTTIVHLIGQNAVLSGSGRVPQPSRAIVTISSTGLVTATPTLLSSVPGGAPFTVYIDPTGAAWTDPAYTVPLTQDVYGNPIDPSTVTYNAADGTVATAGTAYVNCPTCANLEFNPPYQMPCVTADGTVSAVDCQRNPDPNVYYGPPITNWLHVCKDLTTTNADGSSTEQYQACALTYRDPNTQVGSSTYDSPAYTAGSPAVDTTGTPVALTCAQVKGQIYGGKQLYYPSCSWSGPLPKGVFFLLGTGTNEHCGSTSCSDGGTTLGYPVTVPSAPPPPPPTCGTPTTPPCDD